MSVVLTVELTPGIVLSAPTLIGEMQARYRGLRNGRDASSWKLEPDSADSDNWALEPNSAKHLEAWRGSGGDPTLKVAVIDHLDSLCAIRFSTGYPLLAPGVDLRIISRPRGASSSLPRPHPMRFSRPRCLQVLAFAALCEAAALTPAEARAQKATGNMKRGVLPVGTTISGMLPRRLCESTFAIGDTISARLGPTMWDVQDWPRGLKQFSAVVERVAVDDTVHGGRRFVLAVREARVNGVLRRDVPIRFLMDGESTDGQLTLGPRCYDRGRIYGDLRKTVRF